MREFENYHIHNSESNIFYLDSPVSIEDYAKRAKQLEHKILSTCNHGFQGNFLNTWMVAKKYDLKFVFAVEAYWVKDRFALVDGEKRDKTNAHIVLIAKDEIGRKQITSAVTEANDTGYYYRPRMDLPMILSLDPQHVMVTTACIAFWGYGMAESEKIIMSLWRRFGKSFFLEVQAHEIDEQKDVNRFILSLYRKHGIQMITACDSHYIFPEQEQDRRNLQVSTKEGYTEDLQSESEIENSSLYMDFPDGDELFRRFVAQKILPEAIIDEAMRNTLIIRTFEDFKFDNSKKVPNPYPDKTKEERNDMYLKLVNDAWDRYKVNVPKERWDEYLAEIKYETDTIVDTDFADYFLIAYETVEGGKKKGGVITKSGRGSGASYFTNTLLGFSSMDRLALPVTLYPDRFVSRARLLAGKLPDLDLNVADREPFIKAQEDLIGADHAFPMIAYGTLKRKAAWKMYARAKKVDPVIANTLSKQLGDFDLAVKHAEQDEEIDMADYVDEKYFDLVKESDVYTGIISGKTIHPCALLIYSGDIKSEIGLVRAKSDSGKVDQLVTVIDGNMAEKFGYLKNDFLRVAVWELIDAVYKEIGISVPDTMELLKTTDGDTQTWKMFDNGYTIGVNQCEREKTKQRVMRYKPRNITELSAFVAAVRPSFKSNLETFLSRKHFDYGIPAFDALIQSEFMKSSFILYQENIMTALGFAGFDKTECYIQLQNIAKKHPEEIAKIKPRFITGFSEKIGGESSRATETSDLVWQIISDASGYGFCCAHAAATAFDAIYIAYAKAHYPVQTYKVMLEIYSKRGDKDRLAAIKNEMMNAFKICIKPIQFGDNNAEFIAYADKSIIQDAMHSIPYMNKIVPKELYEMSKTRYDTWIDLLIDITKKTSINSKQMKILIKLGYFKGFGDVNKLLEIYTEFKEGKNKYQESYTEKTKEKRLVFLREMERAWNGNPANPYDLAQYQVKITGSIIGTYDNVNPRDYTIINIDEKYSPKITLYSLSRGTSGIMKMKKAFFQALHVKAGDTIRIVQWTTKPQYRFIDGKSRPVEGTEEKWIVNALVINEKLNEEDEDED